VEQKKSTGKKLTLMALILMIFTSVFGFTNMPRAFLLMGYGAIPWYIICGITFFILYAFMMGEYGAAFRTEKGGIYSWMEKSVGPRYAFMAIFMWYASMIIWMVAVSNVILIPLSDLIFGTDTTQTWSLLGLSSTQTLGLIGALVVLVVTFVITRGITGISKVTNIGGIAVIGIDSLLFLGAIIVLISSGGHLAQPITSAQNFFTSPNPSYGTITGVLSFVVFAIFAYGGLEVVGGLVDQTEKPERTMPKAIIISAVIIAIFYSVGILFMGFFTNWHSNMSGSNVNLGNVAYLAMQNLGYKLGISFGLGQQGGVVMGHWVARFVGLTMFLNYLGAFVTLSYAPLKQLIEGTPKELWPGSLGKVNKKDVPTVALWVQFAIAVVLILLVAFGGETVSRFFNDLALMCNVAMTLPYMFVSIAFVQFKKKSSIQKPFQIFKTMRSTWIAAVAVTLTVGFANIFTIIQPALTGDWASTIWMIVGPVFFSGCALALYWRYERNKRSSGIGGSGEIKTQANPVKAQ